MTDIKEPVVPVGGSTSDWGQQVIDTSNSPRKAPPRWGNRDFYEVVNDERQRYENGLPSGLEQDLFPDAEPSRRLFNVPPAPKISKTRAANEALEASMATGDVSAYAVNRDTLEQGGKIQNSALAALNEYQVKQGVSLSGRLEPEYFNSLPIDEQMQVASEEMSRLNIRNVSASKWGLMYALANGGGQLSTAEYQSKFDQIPHAEIAERMSYMHRMNRRHARQDIEEAAGMLPISTPEGILNIIEGDMTPIWPWLSRIRLIDNIAEATGLEVDGWWLGNKKQRFREEVTSLTPEEFGQFGKDFEKWVHQVQDDVNMGAYVNKYQIIELMESVFTEGVYDGTSAELAGDEWFGNFETLVELAVGVGFAWQAGKGIKGAFSTTRQVGARTIAAAANTRAARALDDLFQADELGVEFGLLPDEAVPSQLPRPSILANDVEDLPDSTKKVLERSERVRSEILESTTKTELGLTPGNRTSAVNQELTDLDLFDHPHVQSRMSTLASLGDDEGFKMRVVVGETAEGGYRNIQDVMDEAVRLDPNLERLDIMRVNREGVLEPVFEGPEGFARAVTKGEVDTKTAERIIGGNSPDEAYYLVYEQERYWHSIDKEAFGAETFQSGGLVPRVALSPNAKFGDEIYGSFLRAYMGEQTILKNFEIMFNPFYRLGPDDKRFVAGAYEWMEDFGKNHGRAPDINEIRTHYDGITEKQLNGIVSLRTGMDTMHELFNRRLYKEWQALDFKTAKPRVAGMPNYHGKVVDTPGQALDPVSGDMVRISAQELEVIKRDGGAVIELDIPVDVPNQARARATRVVVRNEDYQLGELSTRPLTYHPGYSMRFYDDPYFIVKKTDGVSLNGSTRNIGQASQVSEAIRTAGTQAEAEAWMRRAARATQERGEQGVTWEVVRANDIGQTESTLFQKQALHREGRLFWDERNFDRLPDVNGNLATLEDPVTSLERGVGQAARQLTHEDLLRSIKGAWKNQYGDLFDARTLDTFDLGELSKRLKDLRRSTVDKASKQRIVDAKELIDYMRLIEGTESMVIPALREAALNVAVAVNRWTGANNKRIEQIGMTMDPFRAMRSVAFNLFMVFRPVRQALLQTSQIGYLAALDPLYAASPKLFTDAIALRRGLAALRKSGYDDGFSVKTMAKSMGITEREYRVLLREFDRSGLIDLVDVHSFSGGAGRFRKTALPAQDSTAGTIGYRGRQATRAVRDWLQNVGFNFGERNNLTFTYQLALRRLMKRKKYDSVLSLNKSDWEEVKVEASNLALGMVRPNNFGYQTGALGVATQFLSFSHKAMLGLLGANPALKGTDALRIAMGTYLLYGANMFGGRDFAEEALKDIGIPDQEIPGTGFSVVDLVSAGIVDTTFNMIGDMTTEDWKDIDLGFIAPGVDFPRMWDMQLRNVFEQPTKVALGPFGNVASNVLQSLELIDWIHNGQPDIPPQDKFMQSAAVLGMATVPAFNDAVKAYFGYKMGFWYSAAHEPLPLEATLNGIIARGLVGARTREELAWYGTQRAFWEDKDDYQSAVQGTRKVIKQSISLFYEGVETRETVQRRIAGLVNLYEDMPEGVRLQFLTDVMEGVGQNDQIVEETVFSHIVNNALANPRFSDLEGMVHLVDRLDLEPDKAAQLKQLLKEAHEGRVNVDATAFEELQNGN